VHRQADTIILAYRPQVGRGDWQSVHHTITLAWTPCHYGSRRPWFLCPGCGRRVAVLCLGEQGFRCRHCARLPYGSQRETPLDRRYRKVRKIRQRLGASANLREPIRLCDKPKGMHWRTWERLGAEEERVYKAITAYTTAKLRRFLCRY
jgi:hypothetical protein